MSNYNLVVMTTAEAKEEKKEVVRKALYDIAKAAEDQSGCIEYSVLCSTDNSAVTVNIERWESEEERDIFLSGTDVKKFVSAVSGAFVSPPQPRSYEILNID